MGVLVCNGTTVSCTGALVPVPVPLTILPASRVTTDSMPLATITDSAPFVNIPTFGVCMLPSNPMVAAATAAALGVLTPQPCIPATAAPWAPGSPTVLVGGVPALTNDSRCMCMWGGVISVALPAQLRATAG